MPSAAAMRVLIHSYAAGSHMYQHWVGCMGGRLRYLFLAAAHRLAMVAARGSSWRPAPTARRRRWRRWPSSIGPTAALNGSAAFGHTKP